MRRLLHFLFNLMLALSLMLCLGTVALWARSYWRGDRVDVLVKGSAHRETPLWMVAAISERGGLGVSVYHSTNYYPDDSSWRAALARPTAKSLQHQSEEAWLYPCWTRNEGSTGWQWRGFQWMRQSRTSSDSWAVQRSVVAPYWFVSLLAAILPALRLRQMLLLRRMAWRSRAGLCLTCGYDLRATPDHCPECGTVNTAIGVTIEQSVK